jgi:simple sugar transport system substrate-binding protein
MLKRLLVISMVFVLVGSVVILSVEKPGEAEEAKYTFYFVSHDSTTEPFWAIVYNGFMKAGELFGVKTIYSAPETYSVEELVNKLEAAKPDAIIATITNYEAEDEVLRRAIAQGIPVIASNVEDPRPEGEKIPYLMYIGEDSYQAGRVNGKGALEKWPVKRCLYIIDEPGNIALELRGKGILDFMKEKGIPADELVVGEVLEEAVSLIESYFKKNPDTNLIAGAGTPNAVAAMQFIKEKGLEGKVKLAWHDVNPVVIEGIRKGYILHTVDQQEYLQGFLPVMWLWQVLEFKFIPPAKRIITSMGLVDATNVDEIEAFVKAGYKK